MYFICVEDNAVIGILNYEPEVPETITVYQITDQQYESIKEETHIFDLGSGQVVENPNFSPTKKETFEKNAQERHFLNSTDWMILRHLRQKSLGITTTLSEEQYIELETQRHEASLRIIS